MVRVYLTKITELMDTTRFDDLIYLFKGYAARKTFDVFGNERKLFETIKSGDEARRS